MNHERKAAVRKTEASDVTADERDRLVSRKMRCARAKGVGIAAEQRESNIEAKGVIGPQQRLGQPRAHKASPAGNKDRFPAQRVPDPSSVSQNVVEISCEWVRHSR